jgi:hypothetical protein
MLRRAIPRIRAARVLFPPTDANVRKISSASTSFSEEPSLIVEIGVGSRPSLIG